MSPNSYKLETASPFDELEIWEKLWHLFRNCLYINDVILLNNGSGSWSTTNQTAAIPYYFKIPVTIGQLVR